MFKMYTPRWGNCLSLDLTSSLDCFVTLTTAHPISQTLAAVGWTHVPIGVCYTENKAASSQTASGVKQGFWSCACVYDSGGGLIQRVRGTGQGGGIRSCRR